MSRPSAFRRLTPLPPGLAWLFLLLTLAAPGFRGAAAQTVTPDEWPSYGNDPGGSRYSPVDQINRGNVGRLKVAWTHRTGELDHKSVVREKAAFEATPIFVDGTLYLSTPFSRVIALDGETGSRRWVFDPEVSASERFSEVTSRGVSTWLDRSGAKGDCRRRIFVGTLDARLIALDAATGRRCAAFGKNGEVDLTQDVRLVHRSDYQVTSPPAVIGHLVVVGSSLGDNRGVELERGVVRAFDARTGALRWRWDPIPQAKSDPARSTWKGQSAERTGAANAWAVISSDPERDLVFVPTSSPSPDYYGGERLGKNSYANSIVALRASTGKVVWHFQVVHHDLWDYDVAAQPMLLTVHRSGRPVPAVAASTKMGHVFLLHRETGEPLFPVEERAVPRSTVPGESAWPTQPFPTLPRPVGPQRLGPEDAWGVTPAGRDWCRDRIRSLRSEGIFTPPSLEGSVIFPGNVGGVNWGGASHDPRRGLIVVSTNRLAAVTRLIPRDRYRGARTDAEKNRLSGEFGPQEGTPYAMHRDILWTPQRIPCNPPPWGALTAIDLASGDARWEIPLGWIPGLSSFPDYKKWGSVNLGGSIVTAGGLVFIAATFDNHLRGFDVETGSELWASELPASAQATPMTYRSGRSGRQFLVICAGGHGKMGSKMGDYVLAFALPESRPGAP